MEISQSPMSSPNDTPCDDVKILKGHTSEVCTYLFSYLPFLLPLLGLLKVILFLAGFCLCLESISSASCVWVSTSHFVKKTHFVLKSIFSLLIHSILKTIALLLSLPFVACPLFLYSWIAGCFQVWNSAL